MHVVVIRTIRNGSCRHNGTTGAFLLIEDVQSIIRGQ